ncbi:MAG: DNA mismatch repair protein MutS [Clostridia bacterium]|nr:DNA mismatch repair protein MutS [Clostridia bacterium]
MMLQYLEVKKQYQDFILFYRLGDFYEMFFEDAQLVSSLLELTLTGRDCGEEQRAPMCGVPYHSAETYIGRLIEKGYKVAICEQVEDPKLAKDLVKREVVRIITPGTLIETDLLKETANNYLASLYCDGDSIGMCFADISTAFMACTSFRDRLSEEDIINELSTYNPSEILVNIPLRALPKVQDHIRTRLEGTSVSEAASEYFDVDEAVSRTENQFGADTVAGKPRAALIAVGGALKYIADTQMKDIGYLKTLEVYESSAFLEMDLSTRRNLELCETMLTKEKRGSLLWVLDHTTTSMGARLLRQWIEHPLTNPAHILNRQRAVGELFDNFMLREELRERLEPVLDLERLITKVSYGTAGGRDLRAIAQTIQVIPGIRSMLTGLSENAAGGMLARIADELDDMEDIYALINDAIEENPPFTVRDGGIIKDGYNSDVDELRYIMTNGKEWIRTAEAAEREKTGISKLKIGYNRVFGYYIETPRSAADKVPAHYIRKQTLSDKERYITDELKDMEATILGADDKLKALEYDLFAYIRDAVGSEHERIRQSASALAQLDVFLSLADCAAKNGYVCPIVDGSTVLDIKDGRHPVVEKFVPDSYFVPNDAYLDTGDSTLMLITGPNMAGKSTYMRQTALIILMAQIGSFVPASAAKIGIVDKLFTRVGASDDLASGQSTFMLEMREVAYILNNATRRSFIVYDEIGRGTSTYDGMSIARAVAEYTVSRKIGAKTMFATHYHELTALEKELSGVVNVNIAAKKRGDDVTFLRKIVPGPADDSYGIEVARLAGVPADITRRAKEILAELEGKKAAGKPIGAPGGAKKAAKAEEDTVPMTLSFADAVADEIKEKLRRTDVNTLTPIEALNLIYEWKKML